MALPEPRHLVALGMLAWASASDLRIRRVPNLHWWPFVVAAAAFLLADYALGKQAGTFLWPLVVATAIAVAVRLLYELRLFGGADAKCLMVLAFLLPYPSKLAGLSYPATLSVLFNATAGVVVLPLTFLAVNAARGDLRLPAALLGYRMDLDRAEAMHVWPMERAGPDGLRMRYWQRMGAPLPEVYAALRRAGAGRVWVTPKVPFMVPLAIGLAAYMAFGDLLLRLLAFGLGR